MASFVRGTPLVATVAAAQGFVAEQFLESIEATSQLELDNLLLAASDTIYDQVDKRFGLGSAARVSNAEVFKSAVAYHFLARLVARGWAPLPEGKQAPAHPFEWSDPFFDNVQPEFTPPAGAATSPGAPVVSNPHRTPLFGGGCRTTSFRVWPRVRR